MFRHVMRDAVFLTSNVILSCRVCVYLILGLQKFFDLLDSGFKIEPISASRQIDTRGLDPRIDKPVANSVDRLLSGCEKIRNLI